MFGGVKNISRLAIYSEQYMLMLSLYSLTSHELKQSIVVLKICAMKTFIMENSAKEIFSNF